MKRLLEKQDAWGNPLSVWVLAVAAFATPFIAYALTFIRLENNVENWLPEDDPLAQTYAWYHEHFGAEDKILVSWKGSHARDSRIQLFAELLKGEIDQFGIRRGGSSYVKEVLTPQEAIDSLTQHKISEEEAIRRLTGLVIGPGGSPVAIVVTLNDAGTADHTSAVEDIQQRALNAGVAEQDLALGGSAVGGSALNGELKKAAWNYDAPTYAIHKKSPVLLSLIISVVFAVILLRNIRLTVYVLAATLFATLASVAVVPAVGGGMNMVLVVMPTLLMVLTLSSTIHVVNYYRWAVAKGDPQPAASAVRVAWWPCILAGITTALGLASLGGSPLSPVRDFGIFAAVGCVIALPVALIALPGALQLWPIPVSTVTPKSGHLWKRLGGWIVRRRRLVVITCIAIFGVCGFGLKHFQTETKAIRYFPKEARVVQDYLFLENNLSGIVPIETVLVFDQKVCEETTFLDRLEAVRSATEAIRKHPEISGALSLADFQPISSRPDQSSSFAAKAGYFRRSSIVEQRVKSSETASSFFTECVISPVSLRSEKKDFAAPGDELWRITAHAAIMTDADYTGLAGQIESRVKSALVGHPNANYAVTGTIPLLLRTQQAVLDSLAMSFGMAFIMIAIIMTILLRSVRAGLIAMLPNLLPVVIVFGTISWCGIAVDIGTMITASVALGVAVDGTLHLCETFKHVAVGRSRRQAVLSSLVACGPALCQTTLVVGGGLLMLSFADLLLVSRFGWLMASLVATALVADLILLSALLAGPLGRILRPASTLPLPSQKLVAAPVPAPHAWGTRRLVTSVESAYDEV